MFNNLIEHTGGSLEAIIIIIRQNCRVCNITTLQYLRQTSYWSLQHPLGLWSLGEPSSTNPTRKLMTDMSRFIFHIVVAQSTISLEESVISHIHKPYKEIDYRHVAVHFPYCGCTVDLLTWGDCGSQMVAKWREYLRDDASCRLVWMRDASLFFKATNSDVNVTELDLWSVVEGQGLPSHVVGGLLWLASTHLYLQIRTHKALRLCRPKLIGMWMKQTSDMQRRTAR